MLVNRKGRTPAGAVALVLFLTAARKAGIKSE